MTRGTTPTHTYSLPFDVENVAKARIIYAQRGEVKIKKTEADCVMEGNTIQVRLTQEETLCFEENVCVDIQVRVLTTGGDAPASRIMHVLPGALLENEVLA